MLIRYGERVKVVVVGLGSIGRKHIAALEQLGLEGIPVDTYIVTRDRKKVKGLLSIKGAYTHLQDALADGMTAAVICTPPSLHVSMALSCVEAGVHVLVEKPLSNSMDGVDALVDRVRHTGVISLVGCNLRFHPVLQRVRELVFQNSPYSFDVTCGSYLPDWRPGQPYQCFYSAKRAEGGGVLFDLIHELDYVDWIFGQYRIEGAVLDHLSDLQIDAEDYAELLVRTQDNICGRIHLDYFRWRPERRIAVTLQAGVIEADLLRGTVTVYANDKEWTEHFETTMAGTYVAQLRYFLDCIRRGQMTFNDLDEGRRILQYVFEAEAVNKRVRRLL